MRRSSIVLLVVACWAVISLSAASSTVQPSDNDSSEGSQVSKVVTSRQDKDLLLVSLLDGNLVAVDPGTGRVAWTFDSGLPLVTAKKSEASTSNVNIFPGADGGLYAYHSTDGLNVGLEKLPISLPELVDAAPSLTNDGSVVLGTRQTTLYVLERSSGRLLHVWSNDNRGLEDHASVGLPLRDVGESLLYVGRQEFTVRSVKMETGVEHWNASFGRLRLLPGQPIEGSTDPIRDFMSGQDIRAATGAGGSELEELLLRFPRLAVSADNRLQAYDADSGFRRWSVQFPTPPVGAYSELMPKVNQLNLAGRMIGPGEDDDELEPGALRAADGSETSSRRGQVLVGSHLGSLYALPADDMLVDVAGTPPARWQQLQQQPAQAQDTLALPAGSDPEDVVGEEGGEPCPGGVCPPAEPCSQLVALSSSHDVATMDETELVCPLGLHIINESRVPRPYLPESITRPPPVVQPPPQKQQQAPSGVAISAGPLPAHRLPVLIAIAAVVICALVVTVVVLVVKIRAQRGQLPVLEEQPLLGADGQPAMSDQHHVQLHMARPGSGQPPGKGKGKGKKRSKQAAADEAAGQDQELADAHASVQASSSDASSSTAHRQKQQQDQQQDEQQDEMEQQRKRADSSVQEPSGPSSASAATDQASGTTAISRRSSESGTFLQDRAVVAPDGTVQIGRLKVGPGIVGYGSAGTIVYDGVLDGRPVAVKRLLRQFANLARKEIDVLIVSDEHPNVVRCFAMEEDREFVYVALERCKMTLSELITGPEPGSGSSSSAGVHKWGGEGPLPGLNVQGMQLISDMAAGLAALHARGIVHRDLKPHNVLLTESGRAKLSDMGLSKQLVAQQSSFESHGSGGSSGWQAPEQLIAKDGGSIRQSRSMDVFSLGCIIHYCITGGRHPFGEQYERDVNIMRGRPDLQHLQGCPEALNLVAAMVQQEPSQRPSMEAVLAHPLWWSEEQRLQFLVDISDRMEFEDREPDQTLLGWLEACAGPALGRPGNWGVGLDTELVANLGRYRRYDYASLRDLLRVVRNKRNHFREMPENLQALMGPLPEGYYRYFSTRFRNLLMTVFMFALKHLASDASLAKYWPEGPEACAAFAAMFQYHNPLDKASRAKLLATGQGQAAKGSTPSKASTPGKAVPRPASMQDVSMASPLPATATWGDGRQQQDQQAHQPPPPPLPAPSLAPGDAYSAAGGQPPPSPPPATPQAAAPAAGSAAGLPLPAGSAAGASQGPFLPPFSDAPGSSTGPIIVGYEIAEDQEPLQARQFPSRPGAQVCDFFQKTGHCRFGEGCIFDHPAYYAVLLTDVGLPYRPGEQLCTFYSKKGQCKFGPACKFHHPKLQPIYAGSGVQVELQGS